MAQGAIEAAMLAYLDECVCQEKMMKSFYQNQLQAAHAADHEIRQRICNEGDEALRALENLKAGLCMGIDALRTGGTGEQQSELHTLQNKASCRFFWNIRGVTQDSHLEVLPWAHDNCEMASGNPLEQDGFTSVLHFMTSRVEEGVPVPALYREASHSLKAMGGISNIHISCAETGNWFTATGFSRGANQRALGGGPEPVVKSEGDLLAEKLRGTEFFKDDVLMED